MCVLIFSTNFVWNISHSKKIWERNDSKKNIYWLHVNYPLLLLDLNGTFLDSFFDKYSNAKFYENPFQMEPNWSMRTDMTKLSVLSHNPTVLYYNVNPHPANVENMVSS